MVVCFPSRLFSILFFFFFLDILSFFCPYATLFPFPFPLLIRHGAPRRHTLRSYFPFQKNNSSKTRNNHASTLPLDLAMSPIASSDICVCIALACSSSLSRGLRNHPETWIGVAKPSGREWRGKILRCDTDGDTERVGSRSTWPLPLGAQIGEAPNNLICLVD